jgi:hypothetical protein
MTRNGSIWTVTALLALGSLAGSATPVRAQAISEARIRELIKEAMDPAVRLQTPATAQPGTSGDERPAVALTLDDAVKFALERNLDIAVQRLNPEINDIAYARADVGYLNAVDEHAPVEHAIGQHADRVRRRRRHDGL